MIIIAAFLPFLLAVCQGMAFRFSDVTGLGQSIPSLEVLHRPEMPSDWVFLIWLALFMLSLIYGVGQMLPGFRKNPLVVQLRPLSAGLFALSTGWMLMAQLLGDGWWLVATVWAMWGIALMGLMTLIESEHKAHGFHQWVTRPLFGLYAGWLSVVVWLTTSSFCLQVLQTSFGLSSTVYALLCLTTIVAFSTTVLLQTNGCRWFGCALLWALYAVLWHNLVEHLDPAVAIFASVSIILVYTLLGITPVSRLFRYVRRTHMREWLTYKLAFRPPLPASRTGMNTIKQPAE
jgi:hypothetical protein